MLRVVPGARGGRQQQQPPGLLVRAVWVLSEIHQASLFLSAGSKGPGTWVSGSPRTGALDLIDRTRRGLGCCCPRGAAPPLRPFPAPPPPRETWRRAAATTEGPAALLVTGPAAAAAATTTLLPLTGPTAPRHHYHLARATDIPTTGGAPTTSSWPDSYCDCYGVCMIPIHTDIIRKRLSLS